MTFTKGIGTPKYMAPEILNKKRYKKAADVYSFAITMYEGFIWNNAYQGEIFKFPWKIANFVCEEKRLEKPSEIKDDYYELITKCWQQEPKERLEISAIITQLETMLQ